MGGQSNWKLSMDAHRDVLDEMGYLDVPLREGFVDHSQERLDEQPTSLERIRRIPPMKTSIF